jgi:hypothetical protein
MRSWRAADRGDFQFVTGDAPRNCASGERRAVANTLNQFDADAPAPELIRAALKEVSR